MGATSVTGVGHGSAEGMNKGTDRMTLGTTHLIGPHVVASGTVTMAASTFVVELPQNTIGGDNALADSVMPYGVHLTGSTSGAVYCTGKALTGFTINGTTSQVIDWTIVKNGL